MLEPGSSPSTPPLLGWVVGVTADRRSEEQIELLERTGARVVHGPTLRTRPLAAGPALSRAIAEVIARRPAVVVLSTGIGVRGWLEAAEASGVAEALRSVVGEARVVARGPKAAAAARAEGWPVDWQAPTATTAEVVDHLRRSEPVGRPVAVVADGRHPDELACQLGAAGSEVITVSVYRWDLPDDLDPARGLVEAAVDGRLDAVTFTSSSAVRNLHRVATEAGCGPRLERALSGRVRAVCVGPVCAATARACGFRWVIAPDRPRLGAMVRRLGDEAGAARTVIRVGGVGLLLDGADPVVDGRVLALSGRERAVLDRLAHRPGAVVAKTALRDGIWGADASLHAVEVTVARLRERLAGQLDVITVPRRGYRLGAPS